MFYVSDSISSSQWSFEVSDDVWYPHFTETGLAKLFKVNEVINGREMQNYVPFLPVVLVAAKYMIQLSFHVSFI